MRGSQESGIARESSKTVQKECASVCGTGVAPWKTRKVRTATMRSRRVMVQVEIREKERSPTKSQATTSAPNTKVSTHSGTPGSSAFAASAPWESMTAVQPMSCRKFARAKKAMPPLPKKARVHSMPFFWVRAPIMPATKSMTPPSKCPNITAERLPRLHKPASISAREIAAPNQISPNLRPSRTHDSMLSFISFLRRHYPDQVLGCHLSRTRHSPGSTPLCGII